MTEVPPLPPSVARTSELPPPVPRFEPAVWDPVSKQWQPHCPVQDRTTGVYCQLAFQHSQPRDQPVEHKAVIRLPNTRPVDVSWTA